MPSLLEVLEVPPPFGHYVQLYGRDRIPLAKNVARYISEGLRNRQGAIIVATPEHREIFSEELRRLGVDTRAPLAESGLLVLDACTTLNRFLVDGQPDRVRFREAVCEAICKVRGVRPAGLRAYGEMVGMLWAAGQYAAATRIEKFWDELLRDRDFSLFCSYPIDIFSTDFQISQMDALLCEHTHLIPAGREEDLRGALDRAMDDVLGPEAQNLRPLIKANYRPAWAALPEAESIILWLRNNLPREADAILTRARSYYESEAGLASN